MQKILAKYGLAAHLAMLAVAPLFMLSLSVSVTAAVMLWLSGLAAIWIIASPSVRRNELPHDARARSWRHIIRDPLTWIMLVVAVFTGLRAMNSGIAKAYNPELLEWYISPASMAYFPGAVGDAGILPFVTAVTVTVEVAGVRHALGSSARMAFLLIVSMLSGLAAVIALFAASDVSSPINAAFSAGVSVDYMVGTAFVLCLLGSLVSLSAAFERKWNSMVPLFVLSIGGNIAACVAFSTPIALAVLVLLSIALVAYSFLYLHRGIDAYGEYKYLVIVAIAVLVGCGVAYLLIPPEVVTARLNLLLSGKFFDDGFFRVRSVLLEIALRNWFAHSWVGVGCGATPLAIEFGAVESDWLVLPVGIESIPNGWLRKIMEVGIVGMVAMLLPLGMLVFAFVRRLRARASAGRFLHPACWLSAATSVALAVIGWFDISPFRAGAVILFGAMCAVSVNSVPTDRK